MIFDGELLFPQPDGSQTTVRLGHGAVAGGQVFDSPSDSAITAHVCAVAGSYGLSVKSLRILHPLDSAIEVSMIVPDGLTPAWTISGLSDALEGSPRQVEGIYVQLDSPGGQKLLATSGAYRMGSGGLWFAPGQDVRFGANHDVPPTVQPTSWGVTPPRRARSSACPEAPRR